MFTRCIHCCEDLGTNEAIEHFPVGRRLAFDSERGRLWVICPHCARWNLTPLEERWEAVEECERLFRGQRLRAQTTNIGFVALKDGTGLVRIGRPLRPEFAAWRYGREFSRRHTRAVIGVSAVALASAGVVAGSLYVGALAFVLPHVGVAAWSLARNGLLRAPLHTEVPRGPGRAWTVNGDGTMILPDDASSSGWQLSLRHHFGRVELRGAEAHRMLATILARFNRAGGDDALVRDAVTRVEHKPGDALFRDLAVWSEGIWAIDEERQKAWNDRIIKGEADRPKNRAGLSHLEPARRLALEMALHEHTEQRALNGELADLEQAWREAEEVAGIADDLLLPAGTQEFIRDHRR